ncbi:MAG: flavin reductase [Asticcacaulis sp.]
MIDHQFDLVDKDTFRSGMSRLGSSVSIITTRSGNERYGFTASTVCSVSDTPPTLLVCVNRAIACFPAFEKARFFCVNTLMPGQEDISNLFGGRASAEDRFAHGDWREGITGAPVLTNASVSFECELTNAVDEATHRIFFGRVIGIRENEDTGTLLYCMRRYLNG